MNRSLIRKLFSLCDPILRSGFSGSRAPTFKAPGDPVTETDLQLAKCLHAALLSEGYSNDEILSEEGLAPQKFSASGRLWILDPLDGTREFVKGISEFAVSVGATQMGKLVAGGVFNPLCDFEVIGDALGIEVRTGDAFPYRFPSGAILLSRTEWDKGRIREEVKAGGTVFPLGSVAFKLGLIAGGIGSATVSYEPKNSWDIAAGVFLVERSGGHVTDLEGNHLSFATPQARMTQGLLASAKGTDHGALLEQVLNFRATHQDPSQRR